MKCEQTESGWTIFSDSLMLYLEAEGYSSVYDHWYFQKDERKVFILPLCQLESLRDLRKNAGENGDYDSPAIFLITGKSETPDVDNRNMSRSDREELFGTPKFGNIAKAILLAEAVTDEKSYGNWPFQNVINVTDETFPANLIQLLENHKNVIPDFGKYRREFYATFVDYYCVDDIDIRNIDQSANILLFEAILDKMLKTEFIDKNDKKYNKLFPLSKNDVDSLITCADIIYRFFNDINYNDFTHRVDHELFRAPIPFSLQELIDAKKDIKSNLHKDDKRKTIKLLLIDNKLDKIKIAQKNGNESCEGGLISVLFNEEVCSLFELTMLEDWVYDGIGRIQIPKEKEKFDSNKFKENLHKIYTADGLDRKENYAWKVYKKIKDSNFVLLDFFLNEENTYLAFNFIEDICKIKRAKKDYSTTWFFITSAVYDSVVKYSQSGLLAEYYESAVVSAGDDPTNEKRQIILVYKLLTFVNSRLRNFRNIQKEIYTRLIAGDSNCKFKGNDSRKCGECIEKELLVIIRRYLHEFDDVKDIFFSDDEEIDNRRNIVESLRNIIEHFLWLPEADWPMIQRQIEHVNSMLRYIEGLKDKSFSCTFIKEEIRKRSDLY